MGILCILAKRAQEGIEMKVYHGRALPELAQLLGEDVCTF